MPYTPLINRLNEKSTTFITFESASNDLSRCLGNTSTKEFVFSHFVCLDLPDIKNEIRPEQEQGIDYPDNALTLYDNGTTISEQGNASSSYLVARYLQDYMLNFEEHLLSKEPVTTPTDRSPAERVFWHWLHKMKAIGWETADNSNSDDNHEAAYGITRYVETKSAEGYRKVVKYIGDIDVTNNVDYGNEAYTEIYVHIPAESGNTPAVLFMNAEDDRYRKSHTYSAGNNHGGVNYIYGQEGENPLYPGDPGETPYPAVPSSVAVYDSGTEYVTGGLGEDCMCVDFDSRSYRDIMANAGINTIQDYNNSAYSETFEFNTVLLYYDVVDISSGDRTSNLYGVLFLGDVKESAQPNVPDYFQRYPKYKPSDGAYNGNSYGFKINLRIDLEPNKQGIHTLVNEYNTFSMSLFADAVAKIQGVAGTFSKLKGEFARQSERIGEIETLMAGVAEYNRLAESIRTLQEELENANLAFADRNTIIDLIAKNTDAIKNLSKGGPQTGAAQVKPGYGISVDTDSGGVTVSAVNAGYSICALTVLDTGEGVTADSPMNLASDSIQGRVGNAVYTHLMSGSNMLRFYTDEANAADNDIVIYINDSLVSWRRGQNMKISFPTLTLDILNGHGIKILTDIANRSGNGQYSAADTVAFSELSADHPVIELICTDDTFSSAHPIVHDIVR